MKKFEYANGVIYNNTFENILPTLQDKSIDLICIDPPNLLQDDMKFQFQEGTDEQLFATFDFDFLAQQFKRITKDKSSVLVFGHTDFQCLVYSAFRKAGLKRVMDLIWIKNNSVNFIHSQKKPLSKHELITLWKNESLNYDYQNAKEYGFDNYSRKTKGNAKTDKLYDFGIDRTDNNCFDGSRFMSSVIYAPIKNSIPISERTDHPTQKSLELISKLVKAFSFDGNTVLDCFLGSGTAAESSHYLKRNFIGVEKNTDYYDISVERVKKIIQQQTLNL